MTMHKATPFCTVLIMLTLGLAIGSAELMPRDPHDTLTPEEGVMIQEEENQKHQKGKPILRGARDEVEVSMTSDGDFFVENQNPPDLNALRQKIQNTGHSTVNLPA